MRRLSPREKQVLLLYLERGRLKSVAEALGISMNTVRHQRGSIMRKLGARNSIELVLFAVQKGLVSATNPIGRTPAK